ncbi:hypothetical protein OQ968_14890 [Mycobacterium sp. 663a-19]|uniref:hypothetical protein n=1 Tax=Mycobacterium sp. 663a-19 TaxID=2986148 RepID=UPI002D1F713C|nr:hypothetical protein [Mycobacterium sp. 663a-19]MEB3982548.1 hypothetical protein [Mycobacterium sp. 663a-19]
MAVGLVATLAPRAFYDHVPWVDLVPPFSEHLMRDYGAMNLSLALVFVAAAMTMERRMVRIALGAYLLFAVPHLIFHVTHLEGFTTAAVAGQTITLAVAVLLPVALLVLTAWRPGRHPIMDANDRREDQALGDRRDARYIDVGGLQLPVQEPADEQNPPGLDG